MLSGFGVLALASRTGLGERRAGQSPNSEPNIRSVRPSSLRQSHQRAHLDRILFSLDRISHRRGNQPHVVFAPILQRDIPLKLKCPFLNRPALQSAILRAVGDVFAQHAISHARGDRFALRDLTRAIGNRERFHDDRNHDRHERQRGQHFNQREGFSISVAAAHYFQPRRHFDSPPKSPKVRAAYRSLPEYTRFADSSHRPIHPVRNEFPRSNCACSRPCAAAFAVPSSTPRGSSPSAQFQCRASHRRCIPPLCRPYPKIPSAPPIHTNPGSDRSTTSSEFPPWPRDSVHNASASKNAGLPTQAFDHERISANPETSATRQSPATPSRGSIRSM